MSTGMLKTIVGRAFDSLLPPAHGVRQRFEASEREFWTVTEVDIQGSSAQHVLERLLEPWDQWWSHSRADGVTREGEGAEGRLQMACFEPLVLHAQALQRARDGLDERLDRVPILRAMVEPKVSMWLDRLADDHVDFSAARLEIGVGPAEQLGAQRWRVPATLGGDFEGPLSFEIECRDDGVTLREYFGDPLDKNAGHGVVSRGRVKNPFAAALLHVCAVGSRFPGLDGMGYVGLRDGAT